MITSAMAPLTTMQILEQRADAAERRVNGTLENFDLTDQADWDALYVGRIDSQLATWARNDFHRLQHQTAKSILAST
jgi:hypothetical protein